MNELDLDKFGDIMNDFLEKNEIRMLVTLPEGSIEPVVEDNVGLGSTVHFFHPAEQHRYGLPADAEGHGHRQSFRGMGQCGP